MQCTDESYSTEYFQLPASNHCYCWKFLLQPLCSSLPIQLARQSTMSENTLIQRWKSLSLLEFCSLVNEDWFRSQYAAGPRNKQKILISHVGFKCSIVGYHSLYMVVSPYNYNNHRQNKFFYWQQTRRKQTFNNILIEITSASARAAASTRVWSYCVYLTSKLL